MATVPFTPFTSNVAVLSAENVDTDQIIPARFLKTVDRTGLGAAAFADWGYRADGTTDSQFVLNRPECAGARVLVAGRNFGCGSSREHAVWALQGAGFRAVVSVGFADIFRGNALGNGLLPIQVSAETVQRVIRAVEENPAATVTVDLASQTLALPTGDAVVFSMDPFAKHCLLEGIDELDFLLGAGDDVDAYEAVHAPRVSTFDATEGR